MSWFNNYPGDGDGLTRTVTTKVDLTKVPLVEWTDDELGFRLAVLYPQIDGRNHLTASDEVKAEITALADEITRRGYDPVSNLLFNERNSGWGWIPGFARKGRA